MTQGKGPVVPADQSYGMGIARLLNFVVKSHASRASVATQDMS